MTRLGYRLAFSDLSTLIDHLFPPQKTASCCFRYPAAPWQAPQCARRENHRQHPTRA